jgi:hypothetical protein
MARLRKPVLSFTGRSGSTLAIHPRLWPAQPDETAKSISVDEQSAQSVWMNNRRNRCKRPSLHKPAERFPGNNCTHRQPRRRPGCTMIMPGSPTLVYWGESLTPPPHGHRQGRRGVGNLPGLRASAGLKRRTGPVSSFRGETESLSPTHSGRRRRRLRFSLPARHTQRMCT